MTIKIHLAALFATTLLAFFAVSELRADINGFGGFSPVNDTGSAKSVGVGAGGSSVMLTDGTAELASSLFFPTKQKVSSWTASFTYQATDFKGKGDGGADGVTFVLQNDSRRERALGENGSGMGYAGDGGIAPSFCYALSIHLNSHYDIGVNRALGTEEDTDDVDLRSNDPVHVVLVYDGAVLTETLKDLATGATATSEDAVDIISAVKGNTAMVGFTGSSGASSAVQVVSNFTFAALPDVPAALRKHISAPPIKQYKALTDYVDPLIGTAGGGNTYPGAVVPFGMVQFSPDCRTPSLGYTYTDRRIEGFSLTHMSGVGCNDYGQVFLTATTGAISANPTDYASSFSHRHETVSPGYYQVMLQKFDVNAELTATLHTGVVRFTYPPNQPANILLPISHVLTTATHAKVEIVGDNEIDGEVTSHAFCNKQGLITVYFAMTVDHPFTSFGTWTGSAVAANSRSAEQVDRTSPGIGAYVSYPHGLSQAVTARIGISFVDVDGARNNLKSEAAGRGFDALSQTALQSWKNELGAISIDRGGDTAQRVKFYTALYHSLLMPNVFSDADGRYIGFDDKPHTVAAGHTEYANFSGWDIYRTQIPLLALIEPQRLQDMCQSIVDIYRYGGWIDRWPQANTYTNDMVGSPLTIIMATAWNDGLHHFDIETAYKGMVTDATQPAPAGAPYLGEVDVQSMNKLGYIPEHGERYGSVSQTEEDCVAYASLADLASSLGKTNDADVFRARAMNYRNNFDPATKFMRPRLASGAWATPFTPTERMGYVEGSAWEYRWLVPFDVAGLIQLLGGEDSFNAELDTFFGNTPTSARSYYDATNEPDIQAPFLYDYSGQPWKTQQRVRELLEDAYKTTPNGIAGNDDCGTMSSWFVLAALGIYTVDPATSIFELTSPLFAKATIHTQTSAGKNAEFVINAPNNSEADQYVQSVALNNKPEPRPWIPESAIADGGTITFDLRTTPNKTWGAEKTLRPPSLSAH